MTVIIEDYMRRDMHLSGATLFVYAALVAHLENGFSTVTQDQLAEELGICVRTVNRSICELKEKKFIKVKPFRDNGKRRNAIMIPKDLNIQMKHDATADNILTTWNAKLDLNEQMTIDLYKHIQKAYNKYSILEICKAIGRYATIINDKLYYKSHLYNLMAFLNRIEKYFENGIEWREYYIEYNKRGKNEFTVNDRDIDPMRIQEMESHLLRADELNRIDM